MTTTPSTPTPRTDAEVMHCPPVDDAHVSAEFARQLERELSALRADIERYVQRDTERLAELEAMRETAQTATVDLAFAKAELEAALKSAAPEAGGNG